jgi:hypothetical protein
LLAEEVPPTPTAHTKRLLSLISCLHDVEIQFPDPILSPIKEDMLFISRYNFQRVLNHTPYEFD